MKNNLISAIAGWKSAALLALVAMVAAVAFSGILTSTDPVEAQTPAETTNGGTVQFTSVSMAVVEFRVLDSSSASGSFTHRSASADGQSILCKEDAASGCDANDAAGEAQTGVQVAFKVDADSPGGYIIVGITPVGGSAGTQAVSVTKAQVPTTLTAKGAAKSIPAAAGSTTISGRLTDENGAGIELTNAAGLTVITTGGLVSGPAGSTCETAPGGQVCANIATSMEDADTDGDQAGNYEITLMGVGRAGSATVTVISGALVAEAEVILTGPADSISAEIEQSSIEIGGSTFIVVTVVDSGGNGVAGVQVDVSPNAAGQRNIVGPAEKSLTVAATDDIDKDVDGDQTVDKGDLPACGNDVRADNTETADVNEDAGLNDAEGDDIGAGTNDSGQCVIQVTAPDNAAPAPDATRGTHSVTVGVYAGDPLAFNDKIDTVTLEVEVGGPPTTISSDAPEYVDSLSSTKITLTVVDDEEVRVGGTAYSVEQVEGNGTIVGAKGGDTTDGQASFTYLASLNPGTAVFRVTAGSGPGEIQDVVIVKIGAAPVEAPDAPPATWNNALVSGVQNVVWNGDDDADVADGTAEGVTAIWQWNGTGWDGYFPAAADVPGGNTLSTLSNGAAYWVIAD